MDIIYSSNRGQSRHFLLDYLRRLKSENPALKVVDVGGSYRPWSAGVAEAFVDIVPVAGMDVIVGDINEQPVWDEITARKFDFCICSHTLEDIRNPVFVLRQLQRLFAHGYIAMPNKHVEFSHVESSAYVGYGHHRWIYTLVGDELRLVAKFPFASYYSPRRRPWARLKASRLYQGVKDRLAGAQKARLGEFGHLRWWRKDLADKSNELAFIWSGRLKFAVINDDFAGTSTIELARLYAEELAEGL